MSAARLSGSDALQLALERARAAGAHSADAVFAESDALEVRVRGKEVDTVAQSRERTLGLRVFTDGPGGLRSAVTSSSDLSRDAVARLGEDSVALARATAPDPSAGLPQGGFARELPDLALFDPGDRALSTADWIALAQRAEDAARAHDARITNSEGASASTSYTTIRYGSSAGFAGEYASASHSLYAQPVATENGAMQTAWWASASRTLAALESPELVGRTAAERTIGQLGARRVPTCEAPVVFDASAARELLGNLVGCLSGYSVYRGSSFLRDKTGRPIASERVTIVDDGRRRGGLGSKPFDGEGQPTRRNVLIEAGVLRSWLLDSYSARKLGLASTGNAARAAGGAPSAAPTNLWLEAGAGDVETLVRGLDRGLLVTGMFGHGFNPVTGDFSRGARGYWIERGERAYPVEEITIAGNLGTMLESIEAIGADLRFLGSLGAPSLRISRMTIAGS
ncbi:MAG TPA: metallopeptidase TldD-related protein [Myxococcota bacterium]|nr:metallopeptidase TldD-related protein [Myxococcota bacterium]